MRVNQLTGLREFLFLWDAPVEAQAKARVPVTEGGEGQINLRGTADSPAVIVTRHYPEFEELLEERIKGLVLYLIKTLDCVTYSSCAGHASADGEHLVCGANVGILPRDQFEYQRLRSRLSTAIDRIHEPGQVVTVELDELVLESAELTMPCLDVNFHPHTPRAEIYFEHLDQMIHRLMDELAAIN